MQNWFRDEAFWRDVTKSVVSGLILALILYAVAVFTGLVREPDSRGKTLFALVAIPYFVISLLDSWQQWRAKDRSTGRKVAFIYMSLGNIVVPPLLLYLMIWNREIL